MSLCEHIKSAACKPARLMANISGVKAIDEGTPDVRHQILDLEAGKVLEFLCKGRVPLESFAYRTSLSSLWKGRRSQRRSQRKGERSITTTELWRELWLKETTRLIPVVEEWKKKRYGEINYSVIQCLFSLSRQYLDIVVSSDNPSSIQHKHVTDDNANVLLFS